MNVILFVCEITFASFSFRFSSVLKFLRSTELKGKVYKEKGKEQKKGRQERIELRTKKEVYL